MKCEECLSLVEEYFDGELDDRRNEFVAKHLDICVACAGAYRSLQRAHELFLNYECDTQASQGFWDNVMTRVKTPPSGADQRPGMRSWLGDTFGGFRNWRFSPSLTAVIVLVAIGITVAVMQYNGPPQKTPPPLHVSENEIVTPPQLTGTPLETVKSANADDVSAGAGAKTLQVTQPNSSKRDRSGLAARGKNSGATRGSLASSRTPGPEDLVREAEQKYVAAINMLSRNVTRRRSQLDAETVVRFEQSLSAVDRTIAETRRAVRRHPGDPLAAKYMLAAYSRKVDVLRAMIGY